MRERIGDANAFDQAVTGLRTWVAHEGAGLHVYPRDAVAPEATVIVVTSIGPMQMVAPCRIVAVFKEPNSFGFSYGTLPGHPNVARRASSSNDATTRRTSRERILETGRRADPIGRAIRAGGPTFNYASLHHSPFDDSSTRGRRTTRVSRPDRLHRIRRDVLSTAPHGPRRVESP